VVWILFIYPILICVLCIEEDKLHFCVWIGLVLSSLPSPLPSSVDTHLELPMRLST
jgi:hypothetical protein